MQRPSNPYSSAEIDRASHEREDDERVRLATALLEQLLQRVETLPSGRSELSKFLTKVLQYLERSTTTFTAAHDTPLKLHDASAICYVLDSLSPGLSKSICNDSLP